jgi:probable regulatory domain-containing protein
MEASYAVVLREHFNRTEDEIAQFLGLTRQSVRNILRANPEAVRERLEGALEERRRTAYVHIAGGLAKLAYRTIRTEGATLGLLDEVSAALAAFQQIKA